MTTAMLTASRGPDGDRNRTNNQYPDIPNPDLLCRIPPAAAKILDVGCGTGALGAAFREINPNARLFGIERNPDVAAVAAGRLDSVACVDVEENPLPFELPGGVDCLIYGDILQQLRNPWVVVRRQLEVLNPGGTVLICVANLEHWSMAARLLRGTWDYENTGLLDFHHLRWFSIRTLTQALTDNGLVADEVYPRTFRPEQSAQFVAALSPALRQLDVNVQEYELRATPLQYVVRAHCAEILTAASSSCNSLQNTSKKAIAAADREVPGISPRRVTKTDISPLIESVDAKRWSEAGVAAAHLLADAGRYQRRPARILSPRADIQTYHQRRFDAQVQEYPATHRVVLNDATVTGQGTLILKDSCLINDSCWEVFAQGGVPQGLARSGDGDLFLSIQPSRRIETPCLLVKRSYWRNYGHWLVDAAALLALLPTLAMPSGYQIVLGAPEDTRMQSIVRETLATLTPGVPIIEHRDNETWEFAELHYVTPLSRTPLFKLPQGLAALRSLILASCGPRQFGKRIFIDRGPEWRRHLENEAELRDICRREGFEFVRPEDLSLHAQAALFNSAAIVVGIKGAALTNLLFCTSSASVIALSSDNWGDMFFWDIAGQTGVKYIEIMGPAQTASDNPRLSSFRIDPDMFTQTLMEISQSHTSEIVDIGMPSLRPSNMALRASNAPNQPCDVSPTRIVSADARFRSRSVSSLTEMVGLDALKNRPATRAVLAPAGSIQMPPCYVLNPPLSWNARAPGPSNVNNPLAMSETPYNHLFPAQIPYPEMWLARMDDAFYLSHAAPFLPDQGILINDFIVPWDPKAVGWFRYEGQDDYRLPIDITEANTIDTAFFLGHAISWHFGHFIADCLSRIHAFQVCRDLFGDVKIILDNTRHNMAFRDKLLAVSGIEPNDIVRAQGLVHCRRLLLGSTALGVSRYASPTSARLWQQFRDAFATNDLAWGHRIYLSRSRQASRKMANEVEVEELFKTRGFTILFPEDLSIEQQISAVSNAHLVAGPAGSAMFNLGFQGRLKSALILLPETFMQITEWLFLAGTNCPVYYHIGLRDMPEGSPKSVADSWRVDMSRLASDLTTWLSSV